MHAKRNRRCRARVGRVTDHGLTREHYTGLKGSRPVRAGLSEPSPGGRSPRHCCCHHFGRPTSTFLRLVALVPGGARAGKPRSGTAVRSDRPPWAGIGKTENNPGEQSLPCQAAMNRFFVPTYAFQSRRAERRSRMPVGHRAAARSVLSGRESTTHPRCRGTTPIFPSGEWVSPLNRRFRPKSDAQRGISHPR